MTIQIRCEGTLYGVISDDHENIEVRCKRRRCGHEPGVIVLHTISLTTGLVVNTKRFREPPSRKKD